ncbi:hypothetical protein [Nostoc sp. JL33]|uniref:hypothetical protein n=1 Tax=Nostoc sp. JL33 TaxID=2815396 RepID=UPI0025E5CB3A|nr:hypothetical protein [Nostoc sp. JL33]MBN3871642.1 hypothetical protein [Nostoc sp. JL33]
MAIPKCGKLRISTTRTVRKGDRTDHPFNSYADSGKVTVLDVGFALTVDLADGVGAR